MKRVVMLILLACSILGVLLAAGFFLLKQRPPQVATQGSDVGEADIASFDEKTFDEQFPLRKFSPQALDFAALKPGKSMDAPADDPCFENAPCFAMARFKIDDEETGYIVREPSNHEKPHRITLYVVDWQEAGVQQKLVLEDDTSEEGWTFLENSRFLDLDGDGKPEILKRDFEGPPADEADQKPAEKFLLYSWDGSKFAEDGTKPQEELKAIYGKK
jgi:hypothetical protein